MLSTAQFAIWRYCEYIYLVLSRPVADDRIPDDTLGNAQHIWNIKPRNPEQFILVFLSLISLHFQHKPKVQICWLLQTMYPFGLGVIKISLFFLTTNPFPLTTSALFSFAQWDSSMLGRFHAPSRLHFTVHRLGATGSCQYRLSVIV